MFARLALTLDELAHELTYDLRCWAIHSLRCRQKLVSEIGLQFHREHGIFTHDIPHWQVLTEYI